MRRFIFTAGVAALCSTLLTSARASAEDAWYGMVTIVNDSPYRVQFTYSWGGDGVDLPWSKTLKPGQSWSNYWTYKYANQNSAPWFYIQVEEDATAYKLRHFAVARTSDEGRVYNIRFDARAEKFKVYAKLYRE